ncbi:hypothetical protein DSECCO2_476050 [anaerobic digester metagenome]
MVWLPEKVQATIVKIFILSHLNLLKVSKFKKNKSIKLNVGCGTVKFPGWINIDIIPAADLILDVRKKLPFENNSVDMIYSEHFIEHITFNKGKKTVTEFCRVLKEDGVLRIATPDLDHLIEKYCKNWKDQDWLSWPEHEFIQTRGQMINISFRWWGHQYLYNEEDLTKLLKEAGFKEIKRCKLNKSKYEDLRSRETRKDSKLVLEAVK